MAGTKKDAVVSALGRVQQLVRSAGDVPPDQQVRTSRVPGTRGRNAEYVAFNRATRAAVESAAAVLAADERFEHLDKPTDAVWNLAVRVAAAPADDSVARFVAEHQRPIRTTRCYIPVEHLVTRQRWRVAGVDLFPVDAPEVPAPARWFRLDPPTGTVAAPDVTGTNLQRMADRARDQVRSALTAIRFAVLAGRIGLGDSQLRFRVGDAYAFSDGLTGWQRRANTAYDLDAGSALDDIVAGSPAIALLADAPVDLAKAAELALGWIDRAVFAADPLVDVLFSFFALEAVLGRKNDKLKGDSLAVRRMTLDHDQTGGFSHPNRLWLLYDAVRSAAVHGGVAAHVDEREARQFRGDVTTAVAQALQFASDRGLKRRGLLLDALDAHPDMPDLAAWLVAHGGSDWQPYVGLLLEAEGRAPTSPAADA